MIRCPNCDSENVGQYRSPTGPIWCNDCKYRIEQKEIDKAFFVDDEHPRDAMATVEDYELVQVHVDRGEAEVTIRNKNGFKAFGGRLTKHKYPEMVYPPDYFKDREDK